MWPVPSAMSIKKQLSMLSSFVIRPRWFGNLRLVLLCCIRPNLGHSWTYLKQCWAEDRSSMWPGSLRLLGAYGRDAIGSEKSNLLGPFTKSACVLRIWCQSTLRSTSTHPRFRGELSRLAGYLHLKACIKPTLMQPILATQAWQVLESLFVIVRGK